jgi:transposase-like protein
MNPNDRVCPHCRQRSLLVIGRDGPRRRCVKCNRQFVLDDGALVDVESKPVVTRDGDRK